MIGNMILNSNFTLVMNLSDDVFNVKYLFQKASKAYEDYFLNNNSDAEDRFEKEISSIANQGFEKQILLLNDIARFAKENKFYFMGDGHINSSLVCYLLNITKVDPFMNNSPFERFIYDGSNTVFQVIVESKAINEIVQYLVNIFDKDINIQPFSDNNNKIAYKIYFGDKIDQNDRGVIEIRTSRELDIISECEKKVKIKHGENALQYCICDKKMNELLENRDFSKIYMLDNSAFEMLSNSVEKFEYSQIRDLLALSNTVKAFQNEYFKDIKNNVKPLVYKEDMLDILYKYGYTYDEASNILKEIFSTRFKGIEKTEKKFVDSAMKHGENKVEAKMIFDKIFAYIEILSSKAYTEERMYIINKMLFLKANFEKIFIESYFECFDEKRNEGDFENELELPF